MAKPQQSVRTILSIYGNTKSLNADFNGDRIFVFSFSAFALTLGTLEILAIQSVGHCRRNLSPVSQPLKPYKQMQMALEQTSAMF